MGDVFGGQKSQTKPAPEQRFNSGVLTGYALGPVQMGDSKATEGAGLFEQAGQGVGILPDFGELQALAGQSYFGGFGQNAEGTFTNANPVFQGAMNNVFGSPDLFVDLEAMGLPANGYSAGGGMGGFGMGSFGGGNFSNLIPQSSVDNALNYLENTPSPFDAMSGGPIVDEINARVNAESEAFRTQQLKNLDDALEIAFANDVAGGMISHSTVMLNKQRITENVVNDLMVLDATRSLESTRYLGDLAMQDIINQSNNMQSIIASALTEAGINAQVAVQMAQIASAQATALAQAQINSATQLSLGALDSQTQLALQQQSNMMNLLNMGMGDYNTSLSRQLDVATLPIDILMGQTAPGSITNQRQSSGIFGAIDPNQFLYGGGNFGGLLPAL